MPHLRDAAILAIVACLAGCAAAPPGAAVELCPVCAKPVDDGPEVRVLRGDERGEGQRYRCFMCPIMEGRLGTDWTMRAVTGLDGAWVTFRAAGGELTSDPPSAVVLSIPVATGAECLDVHRVFRDEGEFRRYVATHEDAKGAEPRTLETVLRERGK